MTSKRLESLDSLRGLAALIVIVHHCLLVSPTFLHGDHPVVRYVNFLLNETPLASVRAGRQSVLLFFVLSGFVLSLPFFTRAVPYGYFAVRRVCRIWIPYIVAIVIAVAMKYLVSRGGIPGLSEWFNAHWITPLNYKIALQYLFMLDYFPYYVFNTVTWSLVHEMRISLLFPLLMWGVMRVNWKVTITGAILLQWAGIVLRHIGNSPRATDYADTLSYVLLFVVGILLAKHRVTLVDRFNRIPRIAQFGLLAIAVCCYSQAFWFPFGNRYLAVLANNWIEVAGVAVFIIAALSATQFARILETRPLTYIGKISYSLYLYQGTVLFSLVYLFYGVAPLWLIFVLTFAGTILISAISYQLVEKPSITLGHNLSERVLKRRRAMEVEVPAPPVNA